MTADGESKREQNGQFAKGNPGGPGGSRRRASELRHAAEDAITPEHIAAMVRKAARMGLEGNLSAMRFVFERTCGRAADAPADPEPLGISLPPLRTSLECTAAIDLLLDGVCKGAVEHDAAKLLISAIQIRLRAIEVNELDERLAQLEQDSEHVGRR